MYTSHTYIVLCPHANHIQCPFYLEKAFAIMYMYFSHILLFLNFVQLPCSFSKPADVMSWIYPIFQSMPP